MSELETRIAVLEKSMEGCREVEKQWRDNHDKDAQVFRIFVKDTVTKIDNKFDKLELTYKEFSDNIYKKFDSLNYKLAYIIGGATIFWTILFWALDKFVKP